MDNYLSVSQVNSYIKGIFDSELMLKNICIYGEVSSYNVSNNIAYFNIKDEDNLLNCVMFGANKFDRPNLGDMLLVKGSVSYYAKGGRLSFNATSIAPYGRGLLYENFLKLKAELEAKGYFDSAHKKPIPDKVKRIGVVTSATGAVIQDIIDVTTRRNNGIDIVLYPVKVQGVGAEYEIAKGIEFFSTYDKVDVVIVARGGGSLEDLQPFNTLVVAEATYNCIKPIVSAVGHETDYTIIDFVSDLRAPTPSAAAELVAWNKSKTIQDLVAMLNRLQYSMDSKIKYVLGGIDRNIYALNTLILRDINNASNVVSNNVNAMFNSINNMCVKYDNMVAMHANSIGKLNPISIINKGYAKVRVGGRPLSSIKQVGMNDQILVEVLDGKIDARVTKVNK